MGLTMWITSITMGIAFLAVAFVWQVRWIRYQRRRYTTLTYKRLAGNITDKEYSWWESADKHKYKSGAVVISYYWFKLIDNIRKFKEETKEAVLHEIRYLRGNGEKKPWYISVKESSPNARRYPNVLPNIDGRYAKEINGNWELLDTRKLREDAVCFDRGYMGETEEERLGIKCNNPFTGSKKTETELQAEQLLANKEVKPGDMTSELHGKIHEALQESKTLIKGLDKDHKPVPLYESGFEGVEKDDETSDKD